MSYEPTLSCVRMPDKINLKISIVTYFIDNDVLELLDSLVLSVNFVSNTNLSVIVIENGFKEKNEIHQKIESDYSFCKVLIAGENLGYGKAHNTVIGDDADYHLILNPDVIFEVDTLKKSLEFMQFNERCGLLSPQAFWRNGDRQYLCKRYPSVVTLFLRAFAPKKIQQLFRKKLESYCMVAETQREEVIWMPLIVTGCFMLFRNEVLLKLNGFDESYFLYFEDTDLSLRAGEITDIAYVPQVRIIHHGGNVSRKGFKHIAMFTQSMFKFFNKHGWRFF